MTAYPTYVPDQQWLATRLRDLDRAVQEAIRRAAARSAVGGVAGSGDSHYTQTFSAAGTWTISVPAGFGRIPAVTVYSTGGEQVEADVVASASLVTVTFPSPYAGTALLT